MVANFQDNVQGCSQRRALGRWMGIRCRATGAQAMPLRKTCTGLPQSAATAQAAATGQRCPRMKQTTRPLLTRTAMCSRGGAMHLMGAPLATAWPCRGVSCCQSISLRARSCLASRAAEATAEMQLDLRYQGGLYPLQAGQHPGAAPHHLSIEEPGVQPGNGLQALSGGGELDEAGRRGEPLLSATPCDLQHLPNAHAGSQTGGASVQMPDFSDSGGWYEAEHTDED